MNFRSVLKKCTSTVAPCALVLAVCSPLSLAENIPEGTTTTWSGTVYLTESVVVLGRLNIEAGTEVITDPNTAIAIQSGGVLVVSGTENERVRFHSSGSPTAQDGWIGIISGFGNGHPVPAVASLNYVTIENAVWGARGTPDGILAVNNTIFYNCMSGGMSEGPSSNHTWQTFRNSVAVSCGVGFDLSRGIYAINCQAYVCNVGFHLTGGPVRNTVFRDCAALYSTTGPGILVSAGWDGIEVEVGPNVVAQNNQGVGIQVHGAVKLSGCKILDNGGVGLASNGNLNWTNSYATVSDCEIRGNLSNVVVQGRAGHFVLGQGGLYGGNKITDPTRFHVINRTTQTVFAEDCYWGSIPGGLPVLELLGDVDVTPWLENDPFGY